MLEFSYEILYRYAAPVIRHSFALKCLPMNTNRQEIRSMQLSILPDTPYNTITDAFGNRVVYGRLDRSHEFFRVALLGAAVTDKSVEEGFEESCPFDDLYRAYSRYTVPGQAICEFYRSFSLPETEYETVLFLMDKLYGCMWYAPGSTNIRTTAEQAFSMRKGVCQDYAHILLALLRMRGIP